MNRGFGWGLHIFRQRMRRSGGRLGLQAIRFNNRAGVAALKLRPDMPVQQGVDDLCG